MAALSSSCIPIQSSQARFLSAGSSLNPADPSRLHVTPGNFSCATKRGAPKRSLTIRASGDGGRSVSTNASIFIGGFVLGGLVTAALGCVYAPQISKALTGDNRKELMRKLPKFIYDEEKALEKNRRILTEKIAQLNAAIDEISGDAHRHSGPNSKASAPDEIRAST